MNVFTFHVKARVVFVVVGGREGGSLVRGVPHEERSRERQQRGRGGERTGRPEKEGCKERGNFGTVVLQRVQGRLLP